MAHFDTLIRGDFGNTPAILEAASKDLAADNQAAAAEDYGRLRAIYNAPLSVISANHPEISALKAQIERLINCGYRLADAVHQNNANLHHWAYEVELARELIK